MAKVAKSAPKKPRARRPGEHGNAKYDRAKVTKAICKRLATGEPMTVICRDLRVPVRTVNDWRTADPGIAAQFDEARDLGYDAIAHDCLAIADDGSNDWRPGDRGGMVVDTEVVQRSKLRIDTRLKLLARWDPRRYGERVQLANHEGGELPPHQLSDEQLVAIIAKAEKARSDG